MVSNNNDTEVLEDQLEQALQLKVKDCACRSETSKNKRRELVDYSPSTIQMKERKWIDIGQGDYSLSLRTRFRRK